jgi:hypothetical protein
MILRVIPYRFWCSFLFNKIIPSLIIVLLLGVSIDGKAENNYTRKSVRGCQTYGFWAEFLWVLNHLEWCVATNQTPVVYWGPRFAYFSPEGYNNSTNGWEYYFEPVSSLSYGGGDTLYTQEFYNNYFTTLHWYTEYIYSLELLPAEERVCIKSIPLPKRIAGDTAYPKGKHHLYSKIFRKKVKEELLDKFIVIKPNIQKKIDDFYNTYMRGKKVIGIHLRGQFVANEVDVVPVELICEEAINVGKGDDLVYFVATDQTHLLEQARKLLNGNVIFYDCYRQETTTSPFSPSQCSPKMGEDVLIETLLLSKCDHFIHTISNVSTAALYFNPGLSHTTLYCGGL